MLDRKNEELSRYVNKKAWKKVDWLAEKRKRLKIKN